MMSTISSNASKPQSAEAKARHIHAGLNIGRTLFIHSQTCSPSDKYFFRRVTSNWYVGTNPPMAGVSTVCKHRGWSFVSAKRQINECSILTIESSYQSEEHEIIIIGVEQHRFYKQHSRAGIDPVLFLQHMAKLCKTYSRSQNISAA